MKSMGMKSLNINVREDSVLFPKYDNRAEVFKWSYNGRDNQLPSIIQHLANESVTARACIKKVTAAIFGKGFEYGDTVVNDKGHTLNQVGFHLAKELATQDNAFAHLRFNADALVAGIEVKTCNLVRIGSEDDVRYSGKFCVYDWSAKRVVTSDILKVDRFNLNEDVVRAQIDKAKGIGKYRGQIVHFSNDPALKYAPSSMLPVLEDCEAEKLSKLYTRNNAKYGFMNTKVVLVGAMSEKEERELKADFSNLQGAENSSNLLIFQAVNPTADLERQMIVKDLTSNPDDKVLQYSDEKTEANICKAFGVPVSMVSGRSDGIFGNSGELLVQMKQQLYEEKEPERTLLEGTLRSIIETSTLKDKIKEVKIIDPWQQQQQY